jgi:hypothetical protein
LSQRATDIPSSPLNELPTVTMQRPVGSASVECLHVGTGGNFLAYIFNFKTCEYGYFCNSLVIVRVEAQLGMILRYDSRSLDI